MPSIVKYSIGIIFKRLLFGTTFYRFLCFFWNLGFLLYFYTNYITMYCFENHTRWYIWYRSAMKSRFYKAAHKSDHDIQNLVLHIFGLSCFFVFFPHRRHHLGQTMHDRCGRGEDSCPTVVRLKDKFWPKGAIRVRSGREDFWAVNGK